MHNLPIYVGCAGWSIPGQFADQFPAGGSHLERYARRFPAVEINSSFYRSHRPATYARWGASGPPGFRFAVKLPREITHTGRLKDPAPLDGFLVETGELGEKLGPWLVQLPPRLPFDPQVAGAFFAALRERFGGEVVCEPRHPTWFAPEAEQMLAGFRVARAAADPAPHPLAAEPGAWNGLVYYRLHGSPRMYYSDYPPEYLDALAKKLLDAARRTPAVWCIFDNTAEGFATANALALLERLASPTT